MDDGLERISHSNRGVAAIVVAIAAMAVAGLAWRAASSADETFGSTTTTPATTTSSAPGQSNETNGSSNTAPTGQPWWLDIVGSEETDIHEHNLPGGVDLLVSSSTAAPGRLPLVRRLDTQAQTVLWESAGRVDTGWIGSATIVDGVLILFNGVQPGRSAMLGFDVESGSRLWISQFRLGAPVDPTAVATVALGPETALLVRTLELGLVRVALATGSPLWISDAPVGALSGPVRVADSLAVLIHRDANSVLLDPETGVVINEDPGCLTLRGPNPIVYLFTPEQEGCVIVGEYQELRVWNKGFDQLEIQTNQGPVVVSSDDYLDLGRAGDLFTAGLNVIDASPYPMPTINFVPPDASPWSALELADDGFGRVRVGMTISEASRLLGSSVLPDAVFDPNCPTGGIEGDPYSPRLVLSRRQPYVITDIIGSDALRLC
ncbi:MAG: hypothetical protein ACN4GZ_03430 [Acidimicrobiales bacterium]